jgi:peptidoglycan/xylan/chitin deacetylase (PgdA/CDA1 family)
MEATILCYHKVGTAINEGRRLNIEPSRLHSHVRFFSRKKCNFLCAGELFGPWEKGIVCFTFDDAYASTMVHAPSIFEEFGARATFYAVPGKVGATSDWDGDLARPLADWQILREIQARGHEIGNHTFNHVHLSGLSSEAQWDEIVSAHQRLLDEGIKPRSFCFPYGDHDRRTIDQLEKAGYAVGVALGKRPAHSHENRLSLPRVVVAYSDVLPMLLYKLKLKPRFRRSSSRRPN